MSAHTQRVSKILGQSRKLWMVNLLSLTLVTWGCDDLPSPPDIVIDAELPIDMEIVDQAPPTPACGDGVVNRVVEECDDGDDDDADECRNDCVIARCGDGVQRADLTPEDEGFEAQKYKLPLYLSLSLPLYTR